MDILSTEAYLLYIKRNWRFNCALLTIIVNFWSTTQVLLDYICESRCHQDTHFKALEICNSDNIACKITCEGGTEAAKQLPVKLAVKAEQNLQSSFCGQ